MPVFKSALVAAFLILATMTFARPALADSWSLPEKKVVYSTNKQFRVTVMPRQLSNQLEFFEDKVKGQEPAGQSANGPGSASASLERRAGKRWVLVWGGPIANDVSPVDAIVSNDGRIVATFDEWHFMGSGPNVLVIYGPEGRKLRSLSLTDIMPEPLASAAPRSVSSIWWRGNPSFTAIGSIAIPLRIQRPNDDIPLTEPLEIWVSLNPLTGAVIPGDRTRWAEALALAKQTKDAYARMEIERKRFWEEPIQAPTNGKEPDWYGYLNQVFYRLDPEWRDGSASTTVLRSSSAKDYAASVGWLRGALNDADGWREGAIAIGSPDSANLVREIEMVAPTLKQNALERFTIYVAVLPSYHERVKRALSAVGGRLVLIDPSVPIPQRPERLRSEPDAIEAAADALADALDKDH